VVTSKQLIFPRILVVPTGKLQSGFSPFTLKVDTLNYPPVSEELWAKHLRTDQVDVIAMGKGGIEESRLEDYVVSGLVDFDDVSYDFTLRPALRPGWSGGQATAQLLARRPRDAQVLSCYQRDIARSFTSNAGTTLGKRRPDTK